MRQFIVAPLVGAAAIILSSCVAIPNSDIAVGLKEIVPPWIVVPKPSAMVHQMPELRTHIVSFETTEGTFMSVDVSPDGETIVFDLLGDLYALSIKGGDAIPLTIGAAWDQAPRFSPDGTQVYFVSDRDWHKNVWQLTLADQSVRQITRSDTDVLGGPNWSQDGSRLLAGVAAKNETGSDVILHSVNPISEVMMPINSPSVALSDEETGERLRHRWRAYSGIETSDGKVFFSESQLTPDYMSSVTRLFEFDRKSQTRATITPSDASHNEHKPLLSHDGKLLAYFREYNEHRTELRVLNRMTGQDDVLVTLTDVEYAAYGEREDSRPNYAFTPDDQSVIFWHAGKIHRVKLADGSMQIIPFRVVVEREVTARVRPTVKRLDDAIEAATLRWPSLSRGGRILVFSAFAYVWVMDVATGDLRRLSDSDDFEYMPAISPDGSSVAYISFAQSGKEYGFGRLMVADLAGRKPRELLAEVNEDYILPKWSADGSMIAVIREVDRKRSINAVFGWTPAASGVFHEVATTSAFGGIVNFFVYARHVKFNAADDKLLFSYPQSKTETILVAAELNGGSPQTLAIGTSEVGGIIPAPDLKNLALTRRDGSVWLIPFEVDEEPVLVSSLAPDARRASRNGGYYVDWNTPEQFTFGFGKVIYRYRLNDSEPQSFTVRVPNAKPMAAQPIAFTGARLITMSDDVGAGPVIDSGTVVVEGARIAALGPVSAVKIPSHALVIDATGKTIMPGLLDTHYHSMGSSSWSALVLPGPDNGDQTAITFGITSAWNPAGQADDGVPAIADLQKAGRIAGPRLSHAATGAVGWPYETLTSYATALAAVSRHRELGVDVLKEYNAPTRQQRQWLSAAAFESELGIVSHLETFEGTMTRIIDGYTGGDHPSLPASFYKDVVELLRQTGFIWTPNVVITSETIGADKDQERFFCAAVVKKQNQGRLDSQASDSICALDYENPTVTSYDSLRVSRVAKSIALAVSTGLTIGVSAHNKPGSRLHQEMWHLWKGGMPIEDVLRATTMVNAEKLGLQEEIGSLEVGKVADFLVLDANPLDDILNTLTLKYTVQGGVIYDSATAERADLTNLRESAAATVH